MASSVSSKDNQNYNQAEMERLEKLFPGIPRPFADQKNPKIAVAQYERQDARVIRIEKSMFEKLNSRMKVSSVNPVSYKLRDLAGYTTNTVMKYLFIGPSDSHFTCSLAVRIKVVFIKFYDNAMLFKSAYQEEAKTALQEIYKTVGMLKAPAQLILSYLDPDSLLGALSSEPAFHPQDPALPETAP